MRLQRKSRAGKRSDTGDFTALAAVVSLFPCDLSAARAKRDAPPVPAGRLFERGTLSTDPDVVSED